MDGLRFKYLVVFIFSLGIGNSGYVYLCFPIVLLTCEYFYPITILYMYIIFPQFYCPLNSRRSSSSANQSIGGGKR